MSSWLLPSVSSFFDPLQAEKPPPLGSQWESKKYNPVFELFFDSEVVFAFFAQTTPWFGVLFHFAACSFVPCPGVSPRRRIAQPFASSQCRIFVRSQLFGCQGAIFHRIPDKKSTVEIEWRFGRFCSVGFFHSTSTALGSFSVLSDPAPLGTVKSRYSIQF